MEAPGCGVGGARLEGAGQKEGVRGTGVRGDGDVWKDLGGQ